MTTRKFSATDLPHPRYSLEVGRFTIRRHQQQPPQQQQPQRHRQLREHKPDNANQYDCDNKRKKKKMKRNDDDDGDGNDDGDDDVNLPSTCLPRYSQLAQVVEVKLPGFTLPNRVGSNIKDFLGSYCVIENARPELFIRRDFISKFVDKGTIYVAQLSDHHEGTATATNETTTTRNTSLSIEGPTTANANVAGADAGTLAATAAAPLPCPRRNGYKLTITKDNVLVITMNSKQYHRFGMPAAKVITPMRQQQRGRNGKLRRASLADKCYRVEINLHDKRIMRDNKYQDRLIQTLRRLNSINKIYFRFIPDKSKLDLSLFAAHEYSREFFDCVIDEYKLDGCQPVPLTKCTNAQQKIHKNWINRAQLHPSLELSKLLDENQGDVVLFQSQIDRGRDDEKLNVILSSVIEIIDWHGYQLLSLDCDRIAKVNCWPTDLANLDRSKFPKGPSKRYDVSCTSIIGAIDYQHVQSNLHKLFTYDEGDDVVFRAVFLYDAKDDKQLLLCNNNGGGDHHHFVSMDGSDDGGVGQTGATGKRAALFNHLYPDGHAGGVCDGCSDICGSNSGVVYLQDCSNGSQAAREITVIGMSEMAAA